MPRSSRGVLSPSPKARRCSARTMSRFAATEEGADVSSPLRDTCRGPCAHPCDWPLLLATKSLADVSRTGAKTASAASNFFASTALSQCITGAKDLDRDIQHGSTQLSAVNSCGTAQQWPLKQHPALSTNLIGCAGRTSRRLPSRSERALPCSSGTERCSCTVSHWQAGPTTSGRSRRPWPSSARRAGV